MANRSYLYASEYLPESTEWERVRELHSISEHAYDIPLVYKLLLSGNPMPVRSSIWETPDKIAIAGEFASGVAALHQYLAKFPSEAKALVDETQEFLSSAANRRQYFVLECAEIFDMQEGSMEKRNKVLVEEIRTLGAEIDTLPVPEAIASIPPPSNFLKKLIGKRHEPQATKQDPLDPFYKVGLGGWSNILYFQFEDE